MTSEQDSINWSAIQELYPEQYNRDPMEWRFLIYGKIANHDDACYLDFLARESRELLEIATRAEDRGGLSALLQEFLDQCINDDCSLCERGRAALSDSSAAPDGGG